MLSHQQNLETAIADAKALTEKRENDDLIKQLSEKLEDTEKDYREIYNKGKERGYYQDVDFDTFEEIYTKIAASALPKEDSQTREDHENWSIERLVDAVAHDFDSLYDTLQGQMPPMVYLHWSENGEINNVFGENRFLPLSKANEVFQGLNNNYPPHAVCPYEKSKISVLYFKKNDSGIGFKDESFGDIRYDIGSEPKNSDLSSHIRDYVNDFLKGKYDFCFPGESRQQELKESKERFAEYKEETLHNLEQYSKACSKAQNKIIEAEEASKTPTEKAENAQSLTDLFASFDKAEHSQNNITINQPTPDKTSGAGLNDEVKVVGFANDSDLTVLNSPAKSQKSPDIER